MSVFVTFSIPLDTPAAMMPLVRTSTPSCHRSGSTVPLASAPNVSGVRGRPEAKAPMDLNT